MTDVSVQAYEGICKYCANCTSDKKCRANVPWYCAMTLEELEFTLPLDFQRQEKKEMPCGDCKRECFHTATYVMEMWRSDNYSLTNKKSRQYEITYRNRRAFSQIKGKSYFQTERHRTFREVLIDAHKMLDRLGIEK